ncbi:MAG: transglutaminaseTgpA domain-containing protein, partial [Planctomycetota bacterium]|nr:transglutaminaseTgpA domain-containing protein [Planctomycetota bacterium]
MFRRSNDNILVGLLLLVSAWTLALGAQSYYFASGLTLVILLNLLAGVTLPARPTMFTELLLAAPFAIWFRYMPTGGFTGLPPIDLLFMFGFYSLTLGAHHLLTTRIGGSRLQAMAAGIIGMTLAGTAPRNPYFLPLVCLFIPLILLELRRSLDLLSSRLGRGQAVRLGSALAVLLALTAGVQYVVTVHLPPLNRWLTQRIEGSMNRASGFSRTSHLGNIAEGWNRGDDQQVVLRQFSDRPATHLRAVVYDRYKGGSWEAIPDEPRELRPRGEEAGRRIFDLTPAANTELKADDAPISMVYPEPELSDDYFLPLGTKRITAFSRRLMVTRVLTARSPDRLAGGGYGFYESKPDLSPPTVADLDVPADMREDLAKLAADALGSTREGGWPASASPLETAAGIAAYFKRDYTYHIGLKLTHCDKDPIIEFLTYLKAGHCEYFAASSVLMLRTMG